MNTIKLEKGIIYHLLAKGIPVFMGFIFWKMFSVHK
jgi:hypothetical protein